MFAKKIYLYLFSAAIIAIVLYCYNPFLLYFQNDDFIHIPLSRNGVLLQRNTFRPVCDLSIMLDYWLWGKNAIGYHFTNLLLHISCSVLVYFFCNALQKKYYLLENFQLAFVSAIIFLVYPMHSEAVFWILGRSAILGSLFFLLSVIFYLKREKKTFISLSIFFALIAWLSYESTWLLPIVVFTISCVDTKIGYSTFKRQIPFFSSFVIAFLLYLFARNYFIHEIIGPYEAGSFLHFNIRYLIVNFFTLITRSWLPPFSGISLSIAFAVIVLVAFALFYLSKRKKNLHQFISILITIWLIALLPCASIGVDLYGTEGERFLYLPSVFICMTIAFFIDYFFRSNHLKIIFFVLIFFSLAGILYFNATNYRLAGTITKTTIEAVTQLGNKQNIIVQNLPQSQNGALIFRDGFNEAIQWMNDPEIMTSIFICSQRQEDKPLQNLYKTMYADEGIIDNCPNAFGEKIPNSVFFNYTDSALIIVK